MLATALRIRLSRLACRCLKKERLILQIRPRTRSTITINKTNPSPPVGKYPQFRLCGHLGSAPSSANTRITIKMVPKHLCSFPATLHPDLRMEWQKDSQRQVTHFRPVAEGDSSPSSFWRDWRSNICATLLSINIRRTAASFIRARLGKGS